MSNIIKEIYDSRLSKGNRHAISAMTSLPKKDRDANYYNALSLLHMFEENLSRALISSALSFIERPSLEAIANLHSILTNNGHRQTANNLVIKLIQRAKPETGHEFITLIYKLIENSTKIERRNYNLDQKLVNILQTMEQEEKTKLGYNALALIYEAREEYDQAAKFFKLSNDIENLHYKDPDPVWRAHMKEQKATLAMTKNLTALNIAEYEEFKPIFIMGLPRCGSTLLEQSLSNHSEISAVGEVNYLTLSILDTIDNISSITSNHLRQIRDKYFSFVRSRNISTEFVIDKNLLNFRWMPIMSLAFPDCLKLLVTRDLTACMWSNYTKRFDHDALYFGNSFEGFHEYFWQYYETSIRTFERYPNLNLYRIKYEDYAVNPDEKFKKILQKLNLNWEENVLRPDLNKRVAQTASKLQVMEGISKRVNGSLLNYNNFIGDAAFDSSKFEH